MFEDADLENDFEESPPPEETDNRTFLIAAGILGGITLLALICMAAYVLLIAPRQRDGRNAELTAIAAQSTEAAMVERAQTQTASAPTATSPPTSTSTPTSTSSPTPVVAQPTEILGPTLENTGDLTPEIIAGIVASNPQLLEDLTEEMLLAMQAELLSALPESFLTGLDPAVLAVLEARLNPPATNPAPIPLPGSWIAAAAEGGDTIETTADLSVDIVEEYGFFEPPLVNDLTSETLLVIPVGVLVTLPDDYVETLDLNLQALIDYRLDPFDPDTAAVDLPDSWRDAALGQTPVPTPGPRTATVAALLTQAADQTMTVVPTATALPDTGFADDIGAPSLLALAALFVVVIFLVRRLRKIGV